jgi:hypothetical protein
MNCSKQALSQSRLAAVPATGIEVMPDAPALGLTFVPPLPAADAEAPASPLRPADAEVSLPPAPATGASVAELPLALDDAAATAAPAAPVALVVITVGGLLAGTSLRGSPPSAAAATTIGVVSKRHAEMQCTPTDSANAIHWTRIIYLQVHALRTIPVYEPWPQPRSIMTAGEQFSS